jgi:hypothetical protein
MQAIVPKRSRVNSKEDALLPQNSISSQAVTLTIYVNPPTFAFPSPETAPANVMLAQVLQARRFADELADLHFDIQILFSLEVSARQLLFDTCKYLDGSLILYLFGLRIFFLAACCGSAGTASGTEGFRAMTRFGNAARESRASWARIDTGHDAVAAL